MNWDAVGAIGEIVGATAVFASLAYLAIQMRANARALRSNAAWNAETIFGEANLSIAQDPEFARLMGRSYDPEAKISDFNETELVQLHFGVRATMQYMQAQWFLWKHGDLPDEIWQYRRRWARAYIELPVPGAIWKLEAEQHVIAEELKNEILNSPHEGRLSMGRVDKH